MNAAAGAGVIAFFWPEEDFRDAGLAPPPGYAMRFGRSGDRQAMEAASAGADYIIAASGFGEVDRALLDLAPRARLVQLTGAGFDNVDRALCAERGIPVAHVPGLNAPSVAQLAVLMALTLRRGLVPLARGSAEAWAESRRANRLGEELQGRIGIVGFGRIGRLAARMFAGFAVEVVRAARPGQEDDAVPAMPLDALLESSDVVVVTLPMTPETGGLIDARRIALMRPGALLVNVSRGGIVDEAAVAAALRDGRLGGAGFDVFAEEPLDGHHPFLELPAEVRSRLILTPHCAGQTRQSKSRNFRVALDNVLRVARGEPPLHLIPPPG